MCDTLASSAANQGDNTVSVAQGGRSACNVMVIIVENGYGKPSSNSRQSCLMRYNSTQNTKDFTSFYYEYML